jgi:hypothetical protein
LVGITVIGSQFNPHVRGAVVCCDDQDTPGVDEGNRDGWTLAYHKPLVNFADAGINITHFRTGPYASNDNYGPYDAILGPLSDSVADANALGIYVEVDLVDNWALKDDVDNNYWHDKCDVTQGAPPKRYLDWVKMVVDATGDKAVLYNLGNETFFCNPSVAWETGLYQAVKDELAAKGWPDRPVGSQYNLKEPNPQFEARTAFDYRTFGDTRPQVYIDALRQGIIPSDLPVMLVEAGGEYHTPDEWHQYIADAEGMGAYIMVWRGDHMNDDDFQAAYTAPAYSQTEAIPYRPPIKRGLR